MSRPLAFVFCCTLVACAGRIGSPPVPPVQLEQQAISTATVNALIAVKIPAQAAAARSITVSVNGGTATAHNLLAAGPGCFTVGALVTCKFTVAAPIGVDTLALKTFTGVNGTGSPITSGTFLESVVSGSGFPFTLAGTVASVALALKTTSPRECDPAVSMPLYIKAETSSFDTILGSYGTTISLHDSDTSGTTSLSAAGVTTTATSVTLHYNGHLLKSAAITPSVAGILPQHMHGTTLTPQQMLYVGEGNASTPSRIFVFPANANGNVSPTRTIEAFDNGGPILDEALALSKNCTLYIYSEKDGAGDPNSEEIISIPAGGNGLVAATTSIIGPLTGLYQFFQLQMHVDSGGRLIVPVNTVTPFADGGNAIGIFNAGANGDVAPNVLIHGSATQLVSVDAVAVSPNGSIAAADRRNNSITIFRPNASGNVSPSAVIKGSNTKLSDPVYVGFDSTGKIYASNAGKPGIFVFPSNANGNIAPEFTITNNGGDLELDYNSDLYVSGLEVDSYPPGANGAATPRTRLGGSNTGFVDAFTIAL